ncbi:MAG: YraN family protein [Burkholderiales bacterium]
MSDRGQAAEALAADYLRQHGLSILERNFRCRFGEIDLIARDGDAVVFVEVRMRGRSDFGGAAESITAAKRERLRKAAGLYLSQQRTTPRCRFDAVLVSGADGRIEWIRDAFGN